MKKLLSTILVATSLQFAIAQDAAPARQVSPEKRIEMRLERLKTELSLTNEQLPKIKELLMQQDGLRDLKPEERRAAFQEIQTKMDAILTPEQKEKQKALQEERRKKMMERREQMQKKDDAQSGKTPETEKPAEHQ
jgi:Spy/CpxP family protein refolding chaperone